MNSQDGRRHLISYRQTSEVLDYVMTALVIDTAGFENMKLGFPGWHEKAPW